MGQSVQAGLAFWSGGRVLAVATALVEHFLPLTAKDLQVLDSGAAAAELGFASRRAVLNVTHGRRGVRFGPHSFGQTSCGGPPRRWVWEVAGGGYATFSIALSLVYFALLSNNASGACEQPDGSGGLS